jgi:hypothetical protein
MTAESASVVVNACDTVPLAPATATAVLPSLPVVVHMYVLAWALAFVGPITAHVRPLPPVGVPRVYMLSSVVAVMTRKSLTALVSDAVIVVLVRAYVPP